MRCVPEVRRIIAAADPEQPISDVQPLAAVVSADTASRRVQARVLVGFALMAFLLAGIGVHGLLAFTVSARARELSVRIALGARPSDIVISVVRRAAFLSAAGVAVGGSWVSARAGPCRRCSRESNPPIRRRSRPS